MDINLLFDIMASDRLYGPKTLQCNHAQLRETKVEVFDEEVYYSL